jgi:phage baseplate assembly protein W
MSTRADRYTQIQKIPDLFSDFTSDLTPHPVTKDLIRLQNDKSIIQSIKNLVLTNYGERPFQPNIGSNVNRSLFEPADAFLEDEIETSIRRTITANEPRIQVLNVTATISSNQSSVSVNILFSIINSMQPQSLDLILRRVR